MRRIVLTVNRYRDLCGRRRASSIGDCVAKDIAERTSKRSQRLHGRVVIVDVVAKRAIGVDRDETVVTSNA